MISPVTHRDQFIQYCEAILDGRIVACDAVKRAVIRFETDYERQGTEDFPYTFDWSKAAKSCEFFSRFLRHSIGSKFAGQPFELSPWQVFVQFNLFGWLKADRTRRYRRAYVSVARKNGKSSWASGLALYLEMADNEPGAQVFIGATKRDQANIIFEEVERMCRQSPMLMSQLHVKKHSIEFVARNSYIRPLGSDKPFSGLNPHGVIFDELHEWRDHHRGFYETLKTGGGSRTQPLHVSITTAGDDRALIWCEDYNYAKQVLGSDALDEEFFAFIAELDEDDDPFNEANWIKANPNLGVSVSVEYLQGQATEAKNKPTQRNAFIRYHGNRKTTSIEVPFSVDDWDNATGELSDWSKADCVCGGFDLGGRDDLAAFAACARFLDGRDEADNPIWRYEIKAWPFVAESSKRDLGVPPFAQWVYDGHLKVAAFVIQDMKEAMLAEFEYLGVRTVAFDNYNAHQLGEELDSLGFDAVKMPQNHSQFNEPIRALIDSMAHGRIKHDGKNPVLRWCIGNALIVKNSQDRWMWDKKSSKEKIDPLVAITMAFRMAMLEPERSTGSLLIT